MEYLFGILGGMVGGSLTTLFLISPSITRRAKDLPARDAIKSIAKLLGMEVTFYDGLGESLVLPRGEFDELPSSRKDLNDYKVSIANDFKILMDYMGVGCRVEKFEVPGTAKVIDVKVIYKKSDKKK